MSSGLYSGVSGLALGIGLYKGVSGLWSGASGLITGFGGGSDPFSGASLYLNMLSGSLDSRVTFSRGSNATLVDSTGRITYAPANLLLRSEEFNDAAWLKSGATVTANTTVAPDGTNTADKLVENLANAQHRANQAVTVAAGVLHTYTIYAKAAERTSIWVRVIGAATFAGCTVDLTTGAVTAPTGVCTATAVGNGWYRISATGTSDASAIAVYANLIDGAGQNTYTGDGTSGLFVWGAQLEPVTYQTVPGPYVATTSAAYYGPRFDYNPVTLAPLGLLIEEQRVNLQTYSQDWSNAVWNKVNITVTAAATVSPSGVTDAQRIAATATAATLVNATAVAVAATSATFSIYVKQGTGPTTANTFLLRNSTTATILIGGTINYATGVWTYSTGSTGVIVSNAGNGWWRLQMTATTGITSGDLIHGYVGWGGSAATAGDSLFAWGAQLEAGISATSYIPTVASQVTRLVDLASMSGTNFSTWYNPVEGALFTSASQPSIFAASRTASSINVNGSPRFNIYRQAAGGVNGWLAPPAGAIASGVFATANTPWSAVLAYTATVGSISANGSAVVSGAHTIPLATLNNLAIGSIGPTGGEDFNGHIRQIAYFNTRLPDARLQSLTAPPLITPLFMDFASGSYTVGY